VEPARCWCGDVAKVRESTDFADWFGMKFFMCSNSEHDPPAATSSYGRPAVCFIVCKSPFCCLLLCLFVKLHMLLQSPPPLCK
jgi:hypothetical protein